MIQADWCKTLNGKEGEGNIFILCKNCKFYPCENVDGFVKFAKKTRDSGFQHVDLKIRDGTLSKVGEKHEKDGKLILHVLATEVLVNGRVKKENNTEYNCEADLLSYDQEELQNNCLMGMRYVIQVECGRQKVVDGIGDHYKIQIGLDYDIEKNVFDRWEPPQPIVISAQTGQGKNYFVEYILLPYVENINYINNTKYKVLIISNRLALKCQVSNHIRGKADEEDNVEKIYSYNSVADVMTYQELLNERGYLEKVQKKKRSKYIFVICDEAHFFTSDAMFNPYTQQILSTIVSLFEKAIRIYMTATPYECLKQICECEKQMPVFYHFKRDYSYLNVKTYSEIRELYDDIVRGVQRGEKWLIFIDDKEKCQRIKNELEAEGENIGISLQGKDSKIGKVYAVSADSKTDDVYNMIIHEEKLVKGIQVLITTSVLDNGVNLKEIDNIVISDMNKAKCLQMVGRARRDGNDNSKTLYIKRFDRKYVMDRIRNFKEQRQAYHCFDLAYGELNNPLCSKGYDEYRFLCKYYNGDEKDWKNAKHLFGRLPEEPNRLFPNLIAIHLMEKYLSVYENIAKEMEEEQAEVEIFGQETKKLPGQKYLEYQLSWFGKIYCVENDMTLCSKEEAEKNFLDFLKLFFVEKRCIDEEKKEAFKKEFTQLHDAAYPREDKNKSRIYGINIMNKILEKRNLNYKIQSKEKHWEVVEVIQDSEKAELE